jgi:hypothetical protein
LLEEEQRENPFMGFFSVLAIYHMLEGEKKEKNACCYFLFLLPTLFHNYRDREFFKSHEQGCCKFELEPSYSSYFI